MGCSNVLWVIALTCIFLVQCRFPPSPFRSTENLSWHQPFGSDFLGQKLGTLCREIGWRSISSSSFEGLFWFCPMIGEWIKWLFKHGFFKDLLWPKRISSYFYGYYSLYVASRFVKKCAVCIFHAQLLRWGRPLRCAGQQNGLFSSVATVGRELPGRVVL